MGLMEVPKSNQEIPTDISFILTVQGLSRSYGTVQGLSRSYGTVQVDQKPDRLLIWRGELCIKLCIKGSIELDSASWGASVLEESTAEVGAGSLLSSDLVWLDWGVELAAVIRCSLKVGVDDSIGAITSFDWIREVSVTPGCSFVTKVSTSSVATKSHDKRKKLKLNSGTNMNYYLISGSFWLNKARERERREKEERERERENTEYYKQKISTHVRSGPLPKERIQVSFRQWAGN